MIKRICQALCLLAALAVSSALAQSTTVPATEPSSYDAVREVQIRGAFERKDVGEWLFKLRLLSQQLAPEYLGLSKSDVDDAVHMLASHGAHGSELDIGIHIDRQKSPGAKPHAPAFADELVARLAQSIKEKYETGAETLRYELNSIKAKVSKDEISVEHTQSDLTALRDQLRKKTGRIDVSAAKLKEAALKLDDQRQDLELAKLGKQAREKAIQDAIARLSKQMEQKVKDDPIAAELKKVAEAREARIKQVKDFAEKHPDRTADGAVENTIEQAAEARAKFLERQRDVATQAGGGQIDSLNQELTTLNIDLAEIDAKLTALNQEKDGLQWALDHVDQLTHLTTVLADEQKNLDNARQKLRQTQDRLDRTPPVTVRVVRSSNG